MPRLRPTTRCRRRRTRERCPSRHTPPTYPADHVVRLIHTAGTLKWRATELYVSAALAGEYVGLQAIDDDQWLIRFAKLPLAVLDDRPRTPILRRI